MKPNPCPYQTCVDHKKNDCDSHQIEVCVNLRTEYNDSAAFGDEAGRTNRKDYIK